MIKDAKLRDKLFAQFPVLTKEELQNVQDNYFEHFSLYKRIKKDTYSCRCTRCGAEYIHRIEPMTKLKHYSQGTCPKCGKPVTFFAKGRGRKYIWYERIFAVFHRVGENLFISCYDVRSKFEHDTYSDLEFSWVENHRYCLTPHDGAQHWVDDYEIHDNHWMKRWRPLKSENGLWGYTLINRDAVKETFLKYADDIAYGGMEDRYITYLCFLAERPNAEFLIKTGFGFIVEDKVTGNGIDGLRLNWKINDPKKMLKLNKVEMDLLKDRTCIFLSTYLKLRKIEPRISEKERAELTDELRYDIGYIENILDNTGLSLRKILNYWNKQYQEYQEKKYSKTSVLIDWTDYIRQCKVLEYDVHDTAVTMPKDLARAHERLTGLIKIKVNEEKQKEYEKTLEKRLKLEYTSRDGRYQILVPKTVQEIIDEGKRLNHCVGGYADRHIKGALTILFLRTAEKPNVPYYTMEVDNNGRIKQCRGFKNNTAGNPKPQEISNFEKEYQLYLDKLFKKKGRKIA